MSMNMPEKIERFIQCLGVDEDAEDNKLRAQNLLVDHWRQGIQEEVDEVRWRILRWVSMAVGCHHCSDANDDLSSEHEYT